MLLTEANVLWLLSQSITVLVWGHGKDSSKCHCHSNHGLGSFNRTILELVWKLLCIFFICIYPISSLFTSNVFLQPNVLKVALCLASYFYKIHCKFTELALDQVIRVSMSQDGSNLTNLKKIIIHFYHHKFIIRSF